MHDKLRDVAYAEVSVPQRRLLHRRIAQVMGSLNTHNLNSVSGLIATQYEHAGLFEQAVPYYQRASDVAASIYANDDAVELARRGVALLANLPQGVMRDSQELSLQLALYKLYLSVKGWTSVEAEEVIKRAALLSDKVGDVNQRFRTLFAAQTLYVVQARFEDEKNYAQIEQLYMQTQHMPPPDFAGINVAGAKMSMGKFDESRAWFEKIVAVRDVEYIRELQGLLGYNYLVMSLAWNAHTLWCLGYPSLCP